MSVELDRNAVDATVGGHQEDVVVVCEKAKPPAEERESNGHGDDGGECEKNGTVSEMNDEDDAENVTDVNGVAERIEEVCEKIEEVCEKFEEACERIVERQQSQNGPKKVAMYTSMDTETVRAAYDDVRADNTETQWAVFKFDGPRIVCSSKGTNFDDFKDQFLENERAFGYIRIQTGDELSKRAKFLFVTWVGSGVSVIQRAKMSTDKSVIKNIISNFAVELQMESHSEIDLQFFIESLNKASGANYGTGIREN